MTRPTAPPSDLAAALRALADRVGDLDVAQVVGELVKVGGDAGPGCAGDVPGYLAIRSSARSVPALPARQV